MDISNRILSEITVYMKYAKYIPELKRRETWQELVTRNMEMHIKKYPQLEKEIRENYMYVYKKQVLPSMRSMQFAGKPIEISPNRIYNCAFAPVDDWRVFSEIMFLLLGGTGVGYSVQKHHVEQLPEIRKPNQERGRRWLPLKECLIKLEGILESKEDGEKLRPIEVHDMVCHIADAVLAGGIRRAALISLFSASDDEMIGCKSGAWWETNPQRGRANNSVTLMRHKIDKEYFMDLWKRIEASGAGEPGIYLSNDKDWGTNPCCEIALRPFQFCNLTEVNVSNVVSQEDYEARVKAAAFIGTLQAGYTDFHYLRPIWQRTTEKDALVGISMTGIGSGAVLGLNMKAAAKVVRVGKNEAIYTHLKNNHPELIEDEYFRPHDTAVIGIPQKAPEGSILRNESPIQLLERVKKVHLEWVKGGHRTGSNTHNVSATISIREHEWPAVGEWMWENREHYNGLSVLPYDGGTYIQAPFEDCTKEKYEELMETLKDVDLSKIVEADDNTDLSGEVACAGGACEIVMA